MRVLCTGSRTWNDSGHVATVLGHLAGDALLAGEPFVLVHGACPTGLDGIVDRLADGNGWVAERHPAQRHPTQDFGRWPGAGPRRNAYMVGLGADLCVAWIGTCDKTGCTVEPWPHLSHGATGCADLAVKSRIPTWRYTGW